MIEEEATANTLRNTRRAGGSRVMVQSPARGCQAVRQEDLLFSMPVNLTCRSRARGRLSYLQHKQGLGEQGRRVLACPKCHLPHAGDK